MPPKDVVIKGGRVLDPETGLDAVRDVGIDGGTIVEIAEPGRLKGTKLIEASGLVVAPGYVDLHSHAQSLAGRRLQACDGVTTAFDLEAGRHPVGTAYELDANEGSPINFGFSASWAAARMRVLMDAPSDPTMASLPALLGDPGWRRAATQRETAEILGHIEADLAAGALGVGLLLGYAPEVDPAEYLAVAALAGRAGVPTFTHCRDLIEPEPGVVMGGSDELVRAAAETGAHMHQCHVNSSASRSIDRVLALVERCQAAGGRVTIESYPYGASSTAIGASFLAPEALETRGVSPSSITYLPTGERIADAARLAQLRAEDPGGYVIVQFLDEADPADRGILRRALAFPGAIIASDAMPLVATGARRGADRDWPVPPGYVTHPRTAGCFSRAHRLFRDDGADLLDAVSRMTLLPARVLEDVSPVMRRKGRIQEGADADIVVFSAKDVTDQASFEASTRPSSGIHHVLVSGTSVLVDGRLVTGARPGGPIRGVPA